MPPATAVITAPRMKLEISPTPKLWEAIECRRFLMSSIRIPATGPYAKAPIRAGRSEKSNLIKVGMNIGTGISMS